MTRSLCFEKIVLASFEKKNPVSFSDSTRCKLIENHNFVELEYSFIFYYFFIVFIVFLLC